LKDGNDDRHGHSDREFLQGMTNQRPLTARAEPRVLAGPLQHSLRPIGTIIKTELIRNCLWINRNVSPTVLAEGLSAMGVRVTATLVRAVRSKGVTKASVHGPLSFRPPPFYAEADCLDCGDWS
jgi:hypothetical protein